MPRKRGREPDAPQGRLDALIATWRDGRGLGQHMTAIRQSPAREATYGPWPEALAPHLHEAFKARGIHRLYSHQSRAVELALSGENVVIVTPTASGKSLCYHLPVLDALSWGGSALYLFPTKALSQDQCAELNALLDRVPGHDASIRAHVYDGDTPREVRHKVRRTSRLVLTNPDMLHAAILPHHDRWGGFLRALEYIVIDELHTYRGVFGSHVANVIRRLKRICTHHGASPTFICTSATIANPRELAEQLTHTDERAPFALIDEHGAPQNARTICFYNPPIRDTRHMRRESALAASTTIAAELLERDLGTIVFAKSRQSVERLTRRVRDALDTQTGSRVASYRGGYLPNLRRSIERGLREGEMLGVVSTNALELGLDIGQLDACVMAGYPGTIASTWQQVGRAGRRSSGSLAVLVASDSPLDQFMVHHPDYFFSQPPEHARIDPDNLRVVSEHLKCAAYELPWRAQESLGIFGGEAIDEMFEFLEEETGRVARDAQGAWRWDKQDYPAREVSLRDIAGDRFSVVDVTHHPSKVLGEVDHERAHSTLYPGAIYQTSGASYRIERLDYDSRIAHARRHNGGYYTCAISYRAAHVTQGFEEGMIGVASVGYGDVCVIERLVGYREVAYRSGEQLGDGDLAGLPELELHTMGYWLTLSSRRFVAYSRDGARWAKLVYGLGQVLLTAASIKLMCDTRDVALCCGAVADDEWLSQGFDGLQVRHDGDRLHTFGMEHEGGPELRNPTLFVYDRFPGGVGFGEGLYEEHLDFLTIAQDVVAGCMCEQGCPSCVGPARQGEAPCKEDVLDVLVALLDVGE